MSTAEEERPDTEQAEEDDVTHVDSERNSLLTTTPTLRPTLLLMGLTALIGIIIGGYLSTNPTLVAGDSELTGLLWNVTLLFIILILVRLMVRLLILTRTTYSIRDDALNREFTLLLSHKNREVPIQEVRGLELTQSRIQRIFGFGTIRLLTGGTNQSLGFVKFEDIPNPKEVQSNIRELLRQR